jgi:hypothetical protein
MKNAQGVNTGGAFYVNGVATLTSRICIAFMVYGLWDAHQAMGRVEGGAFAICGGTGWWLGRCHRLQIYPRSNPTWGIAGCHFIPKGALLQLH